MYSFTDEKGIIHFTNVPSNSRFKPVNKHRKPYAQHAKESRFRPIITEASRLYGVETAFITAIIKVESDFDPYAISPKGAQGLMQLMPDTAADMNVTNSYDPRENIFGGTRYLYKLSKIFKGDMRLILASYNAGLSRVKSIHAVPDIRETKNYVKKVLYHYHSYKE